VLVFVGRICKSTNQKEDVLKVFESPVGIEVSCCSCGCDKITVVEVLIIVKAVSKVQAGVLKTWAGWEGVFAFAVTVLLTFKVTTTAHNSAPYRKMSSISNVVEI
jgi:hypothetical protein